MREDIPTVTTEAKLEHAGHVIKAACQGVGLLLLLVGIVCALSVLFKLVNVLDNPAALAEPVKAMAEQIDGDKLAPMQGPEREIPLGKLAAMLLLLAWYAAAAWICIGVIYVGARIVAFNFDTRRQVKAVLEELLIEVRRSARNSPEKNAPS